MILAKRKLGNTDIQMSILGLGTVKFGRNTDVKYKNNFIIPNDKQMADLLSLAKDNGINTLDCAPSYGNSEERIGKLIYRQRYDWIIISKAGEEYKNTKSSFQFSRKHILNSIKRSLKRLNSDFIDILLIHSSGEDEAIINKYEVFDTLIQAKQEGLIRYGGMSTKTVAGGLLAVEHSDVVMVCYNSEYTKELPVISAAAKNNKGILIKKALGSGYLPVKYAIKKALNIQGVTSVIIGTINKQHLLYNIELAKHNFLNN